MRQLVARYKAAKTGMKFVLVSTYDTGNPRLADYAQALYNISQTDSSVLFLNLYQQAGEYPFLDANYLVDHVHPNAAGNPYFADQTEALLELAASNVPEPSGMVVLLPALLATSARRSRASKKSASDQW
ncbi:MAG: hypothetical protein JWO48_1722 [Bryobacterales bacterium]|nr:hypothetical protein [Bryobacterales bacterium]